METFRRLIEAIEAEGTAALITLAETAGSAPREAGARMVVRASGGFYGTIGGGELEHEASPLAEGCGLLPNRSSPESRRCARLTCTYRPICTVSPDDHIRVQSVETWRPM